jgi:LysR family hydrogen peroxide-inducible transcriptional activator
MTTPLLPRLASPPPPADVTLIQLAYVAAIDTHRHFARAAEACGVTQPTLSMQLAKLEAALGVTLFDRRRSPVVPTDIGHALIEQARIVLREAHRLREISHARGGLVEGELRLGVIPTVAPYLLPAVLHRLARQHPRLTLIIEERLTDDIVQGLRRDVLDAGIVATPVEDTGMAERTLFVEPFIGYVSAGHRLATAPTIRTSDLSLDDLWLLAEGHCFREQAIQLCGQRTSRGRSAAAPATPTAALSVRFESGNLETLKRLVEQGEGMTLLPMLAALDLQTASERRRLRPFSGRPPAREIRLVRRRDYLKQHLVEAVVGAVMESLPEQLRA